MSFKRNVKRERSFSRSRSGSRSSSVCIEYEYTAPNNDNRRHSNSRSRSKNNGSRRVYVSNLSYDATYEDIKFEFNTVGEVTYVQTIKDDNGRFKGCAVVTFKESYMAEEAIDTLNRKDFRGRKLVVREEEANPEYRARNKALSKAPSNQQMNMSDGNTYGLSTSYLSSLGIELPLVNIVFVANLDFTVTSDNLKEVFKLAGNVLFSEVFTDKEGNSRGFGIVEYEHPVEAVQAISMLHGQSYRDRVLSCRMDRSERSNDSKPRLPSGLKAIGMGLGVNGLPLKNIKSLPIGQLTNSLSMCNTNTMNPVMNNMGVMGAVAPMVPIGVMNGPSLTGQMAPGVCGPMGNPMVPAMPMAMNMNQGLMGPAPTPSMGPTPSSNNSNQSNRRRVRGGSMGNIIEVSNLPYKCDTESLKRFCWNMGTDFRMAEITNPGKGIIKFKSENDASRAIDSLERSPFEGRRLTVRVL